MRKWIIAATLLLLAPAVGAAAVIVTGPVHEQLVEGHTVFSVIQVRNATDDDKEEFAAAVAVLVRENVRRIDYPDRFPGVLWFNDQYLVNPGRGSVSDTFAEPRHPCGAVIAVNAGDPLPTIAGTPVVPATAVYQESYRITDPNDYEWDVDKWRYDPDHDPLTTNSILIWSVATMNAQHTYGTPDDGETPCGAATDASSECMQILPFTDDTPAGGRLFNQSGPYHDDGGSNPSNPGTTSKAGGHRRSGEDFPSEGRAGCASHPNITPRASGYRPVTYNAVLFFFLSDLAVFQGVKDHRPDVGLDVGDASACQPGHSAWPCPGDDDDREGNSHPFNPGRFWPRQVAEGRDNHGGSTGCGTNPDGTMKGGGAQHQHAVCSVDIYFGYKAAPLPPRVYPRVFDTEGATAPYHCHAGIATCNEEEAAPGTL